jgi:cGMP-dependent protein kinase
MRWPKAAADVEGARLIARTPVTLGACVLEDVLSIFPGSGLHVHETLELTQRFKTLAKTAIFSLLSDPLRRKLAREVVPERIPPGSTVTEEGETKAVFVVADGALSVYADGVFIRHLKGGDFFGEQTLFENDEPAPVTTIADMACSLYYIAPDFFAGCTKTFLGHLQHSLQMTQPVEFKELFISGTIGRGGSGIVRQAVHKTTLKKYAIKSCSMRRIERLQQKAAIKSEMEVLRVLHHPFIVKLVRTFRTEKKVHLLMELVAGIELFRALDILGILKKADAQFYCGSTALAMEYLHKRNIVYRDLKPENIILDKEGYIKVVDFGLAKKLTEGRTYTLLGTPQYMAPEVVLMKGYSCSVDTWGVGVLLFECLCGYLPFEGNSHFDILANVLHSEVSFPKVLKDQDAQALIKGLLEKKVEERLGCSVSGYKPFKEHTFFKSFDWDKLMERAVVPPLDPSRVDRVVASTPDRTRSGSEDSTFASSEEGSEKDALDARSVTDGFSDW